MVAADPKDVSCLCMRSSAYQKQGKLELALKDADTTIALQPEYIRGYIRKACVLRAQKDYSSEVDTYLEGLERCPRDESLAKGLQMARRLKATASKASQIAKTTQATRNAAISRNTKASNAQDLHAFVQQTKLNLELQMVALQAQLELVSEITGMEDSDKVDLLFELVTTNGELGSLKELSVALQKASLWLPFGSPLQAAVNKVNTPADALDQAAFSEFVKVVCQLVGCSVGDFTEFVVYQVLFTGVATEMKLAKKAVDVTEEEEYNILNDQRMKELFILFDKDSGATVDFKEVAIGLYPLTRTMGDAAKQAAGLLLMVDKNDQRELNYEQFCKLMLAVSGAFKMSFDELVDRLTLALANQKDHEVDDKIMKEIMVAEEAYAKAAEVRKEEDKSKKTLDALSYSRTGKLFDLWDNNGDGVIDFPELLSGLRRYQKSAMGSKNLQDAEKDAIMIMEHDEDRNMTLDKEEFAYAMANYAEAVNTSLHELIDFMCVVASDENGFSEADEGVSTLYEQTYEAFNSSRVGGFKSNLGTILDMAEGGEDSEAGEDDW